MPIVRTGLGVVTPLITATIRGQIIGLLTDVDLKEGQFVKIRVHGLRRSVREPTGRPAKAYGHQKVTTCP